MKSQTPAISESDKHLLYDLQFLGNEPMTTLADRLDVKESTLRSKINRWYQDGTLSQRVFINTCQLGATALEIFFTPAKETKGLQKKLIKAASGAEGVHWFYRTAGRYDFHIGVQAMSMLEVTKHLEELDEKAPGMFASRESCVTNGYWWFGRKYLAPEGTKHTNKLEALPVKEHVRIDEIDHRILRLLGQHSAQSLRNIANSLNLPQSTIGYRIQAMMKNGVITGLPYLVSAKQLGMQIFRVMINLNTMSAATHKEIVRWCHQQPAVVSMMRMVGAWDYVFRCEVSTTEEIGHFSDLLQEEFGPVLRDWSLISVIQEFSFNYYPIHKLKS